MMKSPKFRQLTCGKCVIIISDGKINQKELCKLRMSTYDLCEQLRQMNVFSINDVAYAIMETNGKLSVLKKSEKQPPDANSLKIDVQKANLDLTVISNGKINNYSLMLCKLTQEWLEKILQENNTKLDEIFLMTANFNKQFNIIKKERYE